MSSNQIEKYESFIQDTLRPRLEELLEKRSALVDEIDEYEKTAAFITVQTNKSNSKDAHYYDHVRIGSDISVQARSLENPIKNIWIHISEGVFVEQSLSDAKEICDKRRVILNGKTELIDDDISNVVNDIEESLLVVEELKKIAAIS